MFLPHQENVWVCRASSLSLTLFLQRRQQVRGGTKGNSLLFSRELTRRCVLWSPRAGDQHVHTSRSSTTSHRYNKFVWGNTGIINHTAGSQDVRTWQSLCSMFGDHSSICIRLNRHSNLIPDCANNLSVFWSPTPHFFLPSSLIVTELLVHF